VIHQAVQLPGFVAFINNMPAGLVTYHIVSQEFELVTLDSLAEGRGVGSALIQAVIDVARQQSCKRVWLITTNDNLPAMRFYQKRGFRIKAVYPNALELSRRLKPQIPLTGLDGIPLRDEIELEYLLDER
jgi:GNAT superfamily N-acetyltransferase